MAVVDNFRISRLKKVQSFYWPSFALFNLLVFQSVENKSTVDNDDE